MTFVEGVTTSIKTAFKESISETFNLFMTCLATNIVHYSHAVTLVGSGILIILYIGGYKSGLQKVGILIVSNTMIKYLLGWGV